MEEQQVLFSIDYTRDSLCGDCVCFARYIVAECCGREYSRLDVVVDFWGVC